MTTTQGNLASMSRFIFRAPRWYTSLTFALVLAGVAGLGAFDSGYLLENFWQGIFFIGIPTVAAGFMTSGIDQWFDGQMTYNRSSLLALSCEVVVVVLLWIAGVIALLTPLGQNFVFDVLYIALASIFALRLLVVVAVSRHPFYIAAIPASIQTVVAAVLLFVYSGTMRYLALQGPLLRAYLSRSEEAPVELTTVLPKDFALLAGLCFLYGLSAVLFVKVIDRPWRKSLGVSGLDFLAGFIGHVAEGSRELEEFFHEIGEEAIVPVTVLSFRRDDGSEKARFVLPMIHPGPMGEIGGGNLPKRVAEHADGLAFTPHATAGHDFNLVTEGEVETIIDAAERAMDDVEYGEAATKSVRVQEGEAKMLGQAFGDDVFLVATYAPNFADDVDYAVGLSAIAEARSGGFDDVLLADAHNCNNGLEGEDLGHVVPGSTRSFDMLQASGVAATGLADAEREPLRLGVAWDETDWEPRDGVGPLGVRVSVVEVGDQRTGYVLIDGNNMEPGLRADIIDALSADLDEVEVMTSDTHIVNRVESTNQVGESIDQRELIDLIQGLVGEAIDDLEPVEAGMASERAEVTVFGNDRTETLASQANVAVSLGGALAVSLTLVSLAVSAVIFLLA